MSLMMLKPATQKIILKLVLEAAAKTNVKQKTLKLETALENKLKRLFIQHGNQYLKKFATFKSSFKESISDDDADQLFDSTSPNDRMASSIQSSVENAVSVGADTLIDQLNVDVVFSLENPRVVDYLENYGADLVTGLADYSKQQLRDALTNATEQGMSYQSISKLIGKMFADWSKQRAKLIAVTEIGNAYQHGNLIVGLDLSANGVDIEKSWLTRGDDRVDPHCSANADQGWIDVNKAFSSGVERPLDHPRCRCVLLMRRKPDASVVVEKPKPIEITSTALDDTNPLQKRFGKDSADYREFKDPSSTDKIFGEKFFRSWEKALSNDERDAVRGYQQQTFDTINGTLRGHRVEDAKTPYLKEQIALVDSALSAGKVPYNVLGFRGFVNPNVAVGDTFQDLGFSSTTLAPNIAVARATPHGVNGAVARIRIPQGTTGAYIETISAIDQAEILLPRGSKFKVIAMGDETIAGTVINVIDLEIVP